MTHEEGKLLRERLRGDLNGTMDDRTLEVFEDMLDHRLSRTLYGPLSTVHERVRATERALYWIEGTLGETPWL